MKEALSAAVVMALATSCASAAADMNSPRASAAPPTGYAARTVRTQAVTLITGDQVTVRTDSRGRQTATTRPGHGRERERFYQFSNPDGITVLPEDALAPTRSGRVDRNVFNVTRLLADGSQDESMRLIVRRPKTASALRGFSVTSTRSLKSIDAVALGVARDGKFWQAVKAGHSGVTEVRLDGRHRLAADSGTTQIGAPAAWHSGITGKGVTVAVLDSGYDPTHPDLAGAVTEAKNFIADEHDAIDHAGHGTHVASILAGRGIADGGRTKGVAPDAKLLIGRVCNETCYDSDIIAGMEWAAGRAKVVNMSLGSDEPSQGDDPMSTSINALTKKYGTLFVVAAGNSGPTPNTIGAPAAAASALTVGAVDSKNKLASFSSQGGPVLKPDITAPGVDITAAHAAGTRPGPTAENPKYTVLSGTSMASPFVAGSAALLAQEHPDWKADQLKAALMAAARPKPHDSVYQQGAGRVDLTAALRQSVFAVTPSIAFGTAIWPHDDDKPMVRPLAYRNSGDQPIHLQLQVEANSSPGLFTLSAKQLTVPAKGTAQVLLAADPRATQKDGNLAAVVVAHAPGGEAVRVPAGLVREVPQHRLTFRVVNKDGSQASSDNAYVFLYNLDSQFQAELHPAANGVVSSRLPAGRYAAQGFSYDAQGRETWYAEPEIQLDADRTVTFDGRQSKLHNVALERTDAQPHNSAIGSIINSNWGPQRIELAGPTIPDNLYVLPSRPVRDDQLIWYSYSNWSRPNEGDYTTSPYEYNIFLSSPGSLPANPAYTVRDQDLVAVHRSYAAQAPKTSGGSTVNVLLPDFDVPLVPDQGSTFLLPYERTEYFSTGSQRWQNSFGQDQVGVDNGTDTSSGPQLQQMPRAYDAPEHLDERWNSGVFGPALPEDPTTAGWAGRKGNILHVGASLLADQAPDHSGASPGAGTVTLYRNGRRIEQISGSDGEFLVPAAGNTYRVVLEKATAAPWLSSKVRSEWTFRSSFVAGDKVAPLHLSVVRFAPDLDRNNSVPAGRALALPTYVQHAQGTEIPTRSLTVEVGSDDGRTWQRVPVTGSGDHWTAQVPAFQKPGYVSLRTTAVDALGEQVTQTIVRAYRIG